MVELIPNGVYLKNGKTIVNDAAGMPSADEARENTIAYRILRAHDVDGSKGKKMRIKFDAMASHDITYVGIIQTARASGLDKFPIPYAMTNCHNSSVCRRRYHQRGRPCLRPLRREEVRRYLRACQPSRLFTQYVT